MEQSTRTPHGKRARTGAQGTKPCQYISLATEAALGPYIRSRRQAKLLPKGAQAVIGGQTFYQPGWKAANDGLRGGAMTHGIRTYKHTDTHKHIYLTTYIHTEMKTK